MEVNGYLESVRVLSSDTAGKAEPDILREVEHVNLALDQELVRRLEDANDLGGLYRYILVKQCNQLGRIMPQVFAAIADYTELLLPDNLLQEGSVIRELVTSIPEDYWQDQVEIIGWLYQYYIAEKKDKIFAGLKNNQKITPENIPAATQFFTPEWLVRFLVENSLGRLWMLNHPDSKLAGQMPYYIKPEQPESDFPSITDPEEIKVCDPACGSGHMLVYAFDLLYAIYEEALYPPQEIADKILTHNLYGLEIDARAGELAVFALLMKARSKNRRFFRRAVKPNICVLAKFRLSRDELEAYLKRLGGDIPPDRLADIVSRLAEADNFGALIRPAKGDADILRRLAERDLSQDPVFGDMHQQVLAALQQSVCLSGEYHVVVANPPYMGSKGMNDKLRDFLQENYPAVKADLFSAFVVRCAEFGLRSAYIGIMSPNVWMSIAAHEKLRNFLTTKKTLTDLVELPLEAFKEATVQICAYNFINQNNAALSGSYIRLVDFKGDNEDLARYTREAASSEKCPWLLRAASGDFPQDSRKSYCLLAKQKRQRGICPRQGVFPSG